MKTIKLHTQKYKEKRAQPTPPAFMLHFLNDHNYSELLKVCGFGSKSHSSNIAFVNPIRFTV